MLRQRGRDPETKADTGDRETVNKPDKAAKQMIIGIDGAFVKGRPPTDRAFNFRANRSIGYTASVGAASEREAIEDALRKAKVAGGRTAVVKHTFHNLAGVSEQAISL